MKNTSASVSMTAFTQAVESEIRVIQDLIKRWEMGDGSGERGDERWMYLHLRFFKLSSVE
jgi:hypothetical protein